MGRIRVLRDEALKNNHMSETSDPMTAMSWNHILTLPCFIINMDRCAERLQVTTQRVRDAGFTNVHRERAVDAANLAELREAWATHGSPKFEAWDTEFVTYKGKQGCFLSHANLWKKMIDERIPAAVIFEDDILFHPNFNELAPAYFEKTPRDFDVLFMGSQFCFQSRQHIDRGPVYCTHAMIVTLRGAERLYALTVANPTGVSTVDCMLQKEMSRGVEARFQWYVWNGMFFPTPEAFMSKGWSRRNNGLVFQDERLGSYIKDHY